MKKLFYLLLTAVITVGFMTGCSDDLIPGSDVLCDANNQHVEPANSANVMPVFHVDGRYLKNQAGEIVNLHGFVQTYSPYFNEFGWNNHDVNGCLRYNQAIIDKMLGAGWQFNFFRLHMDPYWSDTPGCTGRYEGHECFNEQRFRDALDNVFIPMAEFGISRGLQVVMRPPGVCPEIIAAGDDYFEYLMRVWQIISSHPRIKNNPHIMFELANEPIQIIGTNGIPGNSGQACFDAMKNFFQPIVNLIRQNTNNIIWVPGLGYQSLYSGFANNPITGTNIGYAIHIYPGWLGSEGSNGDGGSGSGGYEPFQRGWDTHIKPVADFAPIVVTEMDWAPQIYNSSWGTGITGTAGAEGFGANFKYITDLSGNVSWVLFTDCHLLAEFRDTPGTPGAYTFLNDPQACPWAVFQWFKEYANTNGISTPFPLTNNGFNPSIWENGTFDQNTKTLVTGQWGFGGWQYNHGLNLSGYKYLVAELGNENESSVSFRLFDENDYWSSPATYNFGNSRQVVVDLQSMYKEVNGQYIKADPSHLYIIGFWSSGGKPIVIRNVYATNNL